MAKNLLFDPDTYDLSELLANGRIYEVPRYQRDYTWSEEEWAALWEDIDRLRAADDESHFMGAIVIRKLGDRRFEVIDGQQRLTTISVLILAIIKRLRTLADAGVDADDNRDRAALIRSQYISTKSPEALTEKPKLLLNRRNNDFFHNYLVPLRVPPSLAKSEETNRNLWKALEFFSKRLETDTVLAESGSALGRLLNSVLATRLLFIGIEVEDEFKAFSLFETLNARGVQLGPADLIKNFLFSSLRADEDLDAADFSWAQICDSVGPEHVSDVFRYYFCRFHPVIRNEQLLRLAKLEASEPANALAFLQRMEIEGETLSALTNDRDPAWAEDKELSYSIRILNLFGVKQLFPLLMAAKRRFSQDDFKRVVVMFVAFSFRYTVIGRFSPSDLEPVLNRAAVRIETGELKRPRAVFEAIRSLYVEDQRFESMFQSAAFEYNRRRKKLVRYILSELEAAQGGVREDFESSNSTVEHILPQNPGADWSQAFGSLRDTYINRLANLTLLEKDLNDKARGLSFPQKLPAYQSSKYRISNSLAAFEHWTPAAIHSRQEAWAREATRIWKVNFDD